MKYYAKRFWNTIITQGSGEAAVVLLARRKGKVCSDTEFIIEVHNAQAIPSPARGKTIIFCIVAIIKKENNNEVSNISDFVIR